MMNKYLVTTELGPGENSFLYESGRDKSEFEMVMYRWHDEEITDYTISRIPELYEMLETNTYSSARVKKLKNWLKRNKGRTLMMYHDVNVFEQ